MSQSGRSVHAGILQRIYGIGIQHKNDSEFQCLSSTSTRTDEVESLNAETNEYNDEYTIEGQAHGAYGWNRNASSQMETYKYDHSRVLERIAEPNPDARVTNNLLKRERTSVQQWTCVQEFLVERSVGMSCSCQGPSGAFLPAGGISMFRNGSNPLPVCTISSTRRIKLLSY